MERTELSARIQSAVDAAFDDQVRFIVDLVNHASTRGNEAAAQTFMAEAMRKRGLDVDMWAVDPQEISHLCGFSPVSTSYDQAFNVVGTHRAAPGGGRSLILNGHVDVVPPGPDDLWDSPAFAARVEDGAIYGRGSGDMKAGLASSLFALDALRRAGFEPAGDIIVQSVVDEEATGNGTLACLQRGYVADAAFVPESTDGRRVSAQIGVIWFSVTLTTSPHHVLEAAVQGNAIRAALPVIEAVYALGEKWNGPAYRHAAFADVDHPINVNIGRIEGGEWPSSVPARCRLDFRIGINPGQDMSAARREIEEAVVEACRTLKIPPSISYPGFLAEGVVFDADTAPVQVLRSVHRAATSSQLQDVALTATSDGRIFDLYGGMPTIVYGPTAANVHGANEHVDLASVRQTTVTMAMFIAEWCGLKALDESAARADLRPVQ